MWSKSNQRHKNYEQNIAWRSWRQQTRVPSVNKPITTSPGTPLSGFPPSGSSIPYNFPYSPQWPQHVVDTDMRSAQYLNDMTDAVLALQERLQDVIKDLQDPIDSLVDKVQALQERLDLLEDEVES